MNYNRVLFLPFFILLHLGVCFNKVQRFNANADFLLHESSGITPAPKRDYISEFPSLKPSLNTAQNTRTTQTLTSNSDTSPKAISPKRDYVAPQLPTTKQNLDNTQKFTSPQKNITPAKPVDSTFKPPTSPKRDYVAPQFPTLKPTQNSEKKPTGNVKDLINFYDNHNRDNVNSPRKPSYSSILQGPNAGIPTTTNIPPKSTEHTPKPQSFSSVVSGSTKNLVNPIPAVLPAQKPTTPIGEKVTQTPMNPVLPSTTLNNNKNRGNGSAVTDVDLQAISEELLKKDTNNAAKYVTINYQEKTTSQSKEDKAPQPLLTVSSEAWNIPTIQKFLPLLDNYERDTLINEYVTSQERTEENTFMDAIMSTTVIRHLMNFLKDKGHVTPDPRQQRDFLKQLWFGLYSRGKGKISSSGFEHIFLSELKNGEVSGLHNWIYFSKEEAANRANYLGYLKYVQLNDKGVLMKLHFNQQGVDKPVDSMFIGTSPELEIALYTLCFVTRVGDDCNLKLANKNVNIITHNFRYRSKNYIGSAFPQI